MDQPAASTTGSTERPLARSLFKLARPHQWAKSAFVLVGPFYSLGDSQRPLLQVLVPAGLAAAAFALASSSCYVVNDIFDAEADRLHPRKARRPVASGAVAPRTAWLFAAALLVASALLVLAIPPAEGDPVRGVVGLTIALYVLNVTLYSIWVKHLLIADVMGLSLGFVLRVIGGCAAVAVAPSTWLLNCTFFLAMFLAFGKRLGERRTAGASVAQIRAVQAAYTDDMLRMAVVVTAVVTLLSYAGYVQAREDDYAAGAVADFNLLWLTVLPATFGLLRCMVLLERGDYDDPTELALRDRGFALAGVVFALLTVWLIVQFRIDGTP
ncbi:MAG TPA: UbiA family prenyltransferase [Phycisphaerales bacterium]|nr:UbiA family prenyltransferase [Phycisphaerales bacterium]